MSEDEVTCLICGKQYAKPWEIPGPIERKLWSRIHFRLFGVWPEAVAVERLAESDRMWRAQRVHMATHREGE